MTQLTVAHLLSVGLVLAIGLGAEARTEGSLDWTTEETRDCLELAPLMNKIAEQLDQELPNNKSPEDNISMAKTILEGFGSAIMGNKKLHRKALKLFVSLEGVAGKCNMESFKILKANDIAIENRHQAHNRVRDVFNQIKAKHVQECRPQYKQRFAELVEKVSADDLEKLDKSLDEQEEYNFFEAPRGHGFPPESRGPLAINHPDFSAKGAFRARYQLALNVAEQVIASPKFQSLESQMNIEVPPRGTPKAETDVFEKYVFGPCKRFREHLADVLTPARYEATFEELEMDVFSPEDQAFYNALFHNNFCSYLLKAKSTLRSQLRNSWKEAQLAFPKQTRTLVYFYD